jgi:hypothetical protein
MYLGYDTLTINPFSLVVGELDHPDFVVRSLRRLLYRWTWFWNFAPIPRNADHVWLCKRLFDDVHHLQEDDLFRPKTLLGVITGNVVLWYRLVS